MTNYTARTGLHWVKQGLLLFRKQPGGLMALFFCCLFLSMFILLIPGGQLAVFVLMPLFSVALLAGCQQADQGQRVLPNLLLSGFRKPGRGPLLGLGALNVGVLLGAAAVIYLLSGDTLLRIAEHPDKIDPALAQTMVVPMLIASAIYTISWVLTCFAAPLVYWQKLTVGKALFFSVVSVVRAFKPVFVATVALHLMYFVSSNIVALLFGTSPLGMACIFSLLLLLIVLAHCTLYAAYRELFDQPQEQAAVDPDYPDQPDQPAPPA
ncbi:hypothetical protein ASF61_11900 [Duganella sp. Leaf126]|uniref:BPSS1780 family membrane protein n=1 Tax=Duganella sp. Leaf126 TaxID=1736266 RepID=UPI0006F5D7F2|nr:BPSS1780 family membrane protein [Duganella sp. Leaf126]KQQ33740.1 hypothetical protein ASF61_11900 [Duganella sp. Leaf126]